RAHARGGRARRRRARGLRRRHALRGPGLRAGGPDRGARHRLRRAQYRRRVSRRARARVRLRPRAAAGGVRQLPRRPQLPAAASPGAAGRARHRHSRGGAVGRAPRLLRPLRAHGHLRARAPPAGRPPRGPGHRGAGRHHHRDSPRRQRAGGRGRQPAPPARGMTMDPILLEVLRTRLDAIADEMELTLLKSAASPIVKEGLDASAALFNTRGETIAQAAAIPIHLGALQFAAQRIVRAFPPETMREGDGFLLNDPYDGGTHLPDITLAVPVFAGGPAVAPACTMCHPQDLRGRTPGSVPTDATELYQEGVIIPPTQLFRAGVLDDNLFRLLTRNVRLPDVFTGDLMAQLAAGRLGGIRLQELFATHGAAGVLAY